MPLSAKVENLVIHRVSHVVLRKVLSLWAVETSLDLKVALFYKQNLKTIESIFQNCFQASYLCPRTNSRMFLRIQSYAPSKKGKICNIWHLPKSCLAYKGEISYMINGKISECELAKILIEETRR